MIKKNQNRSLGLLFFFVFLTLSLWPLTKKGEINLYLILIAVIFLVLGLLNSRILSPLNKAWMKLGEMIGRIIAPIVMLIVYFLILTPLSLLVRLLGKDLIRMKYNNQIESYWIKRKKHLGAMDKQFQ